MPQKEERTLIAVLMGVAGSGKTTIGERLAAEIGWRFYDGDDFHPQANVDKMRQGIALTDQDREQWLTALRQLIHNLLGWQCSAVIACSALKQTYRERLKGNRDGIVFVYLKGSYDLIHQRLLNRKGHFMPTDLLTSQFEALEEPQGGLTIDISLDPDAIIDQIKIGLLQLGLQKSVT